MRPPDANKGAALHDGVDRAIPLLSQDIMVTPTRIDHMVQTTVPQQGASFGGRSSIRCTLSPVRAIPARTDAIETA